MGPVEDGVRRTIAAWLAARGVTKTELGVGVGRNQPWVTRYLDGEFDTDIDTLARVAAFFNEPLTALFPASPDADVSELLGRFRATTPPRRELVLGLLREWTPDALKKIERGGRPKSRVRSRTSGGGPKG